MKSLFILTLALLTSTVSLAAKKDPAKCASVAAEAAAEEAQAERKRARIEIVYSEVLHSSTVRGITSTKYDVALEAHTRAGHGSLSYMVTTYGTFPDCKVTIVELTGEE